MYYIINLSTEAAVRSIPVGRVVVRRVISHPFSHHVVDSLPLPHILGMH